MEIDSESINYRHLGFKIANHNYSNILKTLQQDVIYTINIYFLLISDRKIYYRSKNMKILLTKK